STASAIAILNCGRAMAERDPDAPTLKRQGLYPCEAEVARRLSQSEKHWRRIAPQLERQGLPKIDPLMGGRFWPAVTAASWAIPRSARPDARQRPRRVAIGTAAPRRAGRELREQNGG